MEIFVKSYVIPREFLPMGTHSVLKFCNASDTLRTAAFTRARSVSGKFKTAAVMLNL